MSDSLIANVPAAGVGARAAPGVADAIPKQYRLLRGEPMLRHTVTALLSDARIAQVLVAVSPADSWVDQALAGLPRTVWRPCGGLTRALTVAGALRELPPGQDPWVLVHDAARPGLPPDALSRLIDRCLQDEAGGLLAMPVADTVKTGQVTEQGGDTVASTIDRNGLWLAQTPQMFRAQRLRDALAHAAGQGLIVTDESSAIEAHGGAPHLVLGAARNFKVTWPEDFDLMDKWL